MMKRNSVVVWMKKHCRIAKKVWIILRGGMMMATSSIFAKVRIDDPKKAEAFIDALVVAENKPKRKPSRPIKPPLTDMEEIRRLMDKGDEE